MRRLGADGWAFVAIAFVAIAIATPVLFGSVPMLIPLGWWVVAFVALCGSVYLALSAEERPRLRYTMLAVAVVATWIVVVTAPSMGFLPILLVVMAALSVYMVPLPFVVALIALNTVVLSVSMTLHIGFDSEVAIVAGIYVLLQAATALSSFTIIREQRMRRELSTAHVELQAAGVLLSESARTSERLRISRDLHDLIGHQLTVLALELEAARHSDGDRARGHIDQANAVARGLLADVRSTVGEMRTGSTDLADALQTLARDVPGLDISIDVAPEVQGGDVESGVLVRTVQEVITNAIRHAQANELWIEVRAGDGQIVLTAQDDGIGASEPTPGNGLTGLIERVEGLGGQVHLDGTNGFRVTVRVPVCSGRSEREGTSGKRVAQDEPGTSAGSEATATPRPTAAPRGVDRPADVAGDAGVSRAPEDRAPSMTGATDESGPAS